MMENDAEGKENMYIIEQIKRENNLNPVGKSSKLYGFVREAFFLQHLFFSFPLS